MGNNDNSNKVHKEPQYFLNDVKQWQEDYKIQEYKKDKLEFTYFDTYSFEKEFQEDYTINIIGDVDLSKKYDEDNEDSIGKLLIQQKNKKKYSEFNILYNRKDKDDPNSKIKNKKAMGYIWIGGNDYVRVLEKFPIIIIILLLGICCGFGLLFAGLKNCGSNDIGINNEPTPTPTLLPVADADDWDGEWEKGETSTPEQETIEIPGYANLYANNEKPTINLINPDGNTVYFKYTIYNGNELIYETDLIEPNKMIPWNAFETLAKGDYELTFTISCYDINTQAGCNGANQTVKISIK